MAGTPDNLRAAITGESQANQKYLAFAKKALDEGYPQVARLFRAGAAAETVHAQNHTEVSGMVKDTGQNLQAAIEGEAHEFKTMYPEFIEQARQEGNDEAVGTFQYAAKVERIHHGLYEKAAESVKAGKDSPVMKIFVCRCCGNTVEGGAPDTCPICGAPGSYFMEIE